MQKKFLRFRAVMAALCALVMAGCLISHYLVTGSEIEDLADVDETCTVTVDRYGHLDYENRKTVVLEGAERDALKSFLLESSFIRPLGKAGTVFFESDTLYDITVDFNDGQRHISMSVIGNEYFSVTTQYSHLKIRDKEFPRKLDAILEAAGMELPPAGEQAE